VVGAEHPLAVGEGPLEERDRLDETARRLIGKREAVPGAVGLRVVGAKDPLAVGGDPFAEIDGAR
jgi:hypothetical protein